MDCGAALRAIAISESRSIRYGSIDAMVAGAELFCGWSRRTVEKAIITAKVKHANTTLVSDLIFSPLPRYRESNLLRSFSLRHSYIAGAGVPSDHLPTAITNSVMGSGPP